MSPETAFAFKAMRRDGTLEAGVVEAPSRDAAAALISSQGAFAIELSAQAPHAQARLRVSAEDLALGLRALGTLLSSGVPLARALAMMDDLAPPTWRSTLPDVRRRVEQGQHLAAALDASALPLPPHVMGIIEAGEAGSGLARAVERGAQLLETRAATRAALRGALAYPSILAAAGSASVTLLVVVVLPRFANLLVDTGQTLPATTRLVLALASIAHAGLIPALMLLSGMVALWRAWVGRPEGLARWHRLLLDAPAVGPIRRSAAAGNVCSALAALLEAGVPLPAALPYAARAAGDRAIESRLLAARQRIGRGQAIASALGAERALTPTVVRLVRLGEETGRLSEMLGHAGTIEAGRALQQLQRVIRTLEPTLILVFGGLVMIVAAALLQAMYGLRPGG